MLNHQQLLDFIKNLQGAYNVVAPTQDEKLKEVLIKPIVNPSEIDWSGKMPLHSFKKYFLAPTEDLLNYNKANLAISSKPQPFAVVGMNVLDLRALGMCDLIFKRDVYYQRQRLNNLVIGFNNISNEEDDVKAFTEKFEENILEHLSFDIFIESQKLAKKKAESIEARPYKKYQFFTGSRLGQQTLDKYGISDYEHIQFAGFIREEGQDKTMLQLYEKVKNSADSPAWEELGKRCYACGKCTLVCPTCYCFDLSDVVGLDSAKKIRQWGSCFYPEFSQIAGDHKFLDTISKRIFYWYYHKFVAIPEKYSVPGCVSCLRCVKACPAGIDIREVLGSL